jgi:hypothetical protein
MTRTIDLRPRRGWASAGFLLAGVAAILLASGGVPAAADAGPAGSSVVPIGSTRRSATVATRYRRPLEVRVLDADGNPVQGASVTFSLGAPASSGSATGGVGATFTGGSAQATEVTDATGRAASPRFTANTTAGAYAATAAATGATGATSFSLRNLPGRPATVTPGVASRASATAGARFPIRFAVTVTDAYKNAVPGILVTFSAPAGGPSGTFTVDSRPARSRTVRVRSDSAGVAVAPAFIATARQGGYIVQASVARATPAVFALVNERPGA